MVIENSYSFWEEIIVGVQQGSILGPILIEIFVNELLLLQKTCNIVNYADDNTLYITGDCFEFIIEKPSDDPIYLQSWK